MSSPSAPVELEFVDEKIGWITFNRPQQRNAMNYAARSALIDALDRCRGQARVVVLTGSGPAFCAGIDLKELNAPPDDLPPATDPAFRRATWLNVQEEIRRHPAVVIAAVNGFALGGGVTLINTAELAIAADEAQIGMPEVGFGLYPGLAGPSTQLRIGPKRAAWMVLTTDRLDGRSAVEWGLVNRSVPLSQLHAEVLALARRIAEHDPVTLEYAKRALWEVPMHISDWATALAYGEDTGVLIRSRTTAVAHGIGAFSRGERSAGQGSAP